MGAIQQVLAASAHVPNPTAVSILAKLTSWWELNELSGSRADSKGANTLTETSAGTVGFANGVRGAGDPAAAFSTAGLTHVSNTSLQVPVSLGSFCVFGWFYVNANGGTSQFYINKYGNLNSAGLEYALSQQGGTIFFSVGGGTTVSASVSPPAAAGWHFYIGWMDTADRKIRLSIDDAAPVVSATANTTATPTSVGFFMGATSPGNSFPLGGRAQRCGWIKGSFLTPTERTYLYSAGNSVTYSELVAAAT